ncbi:MAG: bifunctional oligoribonuclease/PAP phosphatase NrnA [Opitutaceae bacterium]|nr:bifunctional oligoribonuclease/PAP phosphatase NrnA [Opitutaceae bacterium]
MNDQPLNSPGFSRHSASLASLLAELKGRTVAVVGHARPDGDCIGSQVALATVLRNQGCNAVCVNADRVPRILKFLCDEMPFLKPEEAPAHASAIFVDCADALRPGEVLSARYPRPLANIDHHLSNTRYAENNFLEPSAAATCEMLAGMFLDCKLPIDRLTAQALYTGIVTDTGQFCFNSTSQDTFVLAAELVARGAQPAVVGGELYDNETPGKMQLLQRFLASLKMESGGRVCIGALPLGVFEETGASLEDTEGLVDYARSIHGVEIGVLIEERAGGIKASLRGKDPAYRLDQVATLFNGGGHACAAGLSLKGVTSAEFRTRLLAALDSRIAAVEATASGT